MTYAETGTPDVALEAPTLLKLSAGAVATEAPKLLSSKTTSNHECQTTATTSAVCLPLDSSSALFNALRERWTNANGPPSTEELTLFTDGVRFPLDELIMRRMILTDRILADLIIAQKDQLILIDISDIQGIVGDDFNRFLEREKVTLEKLRYLRMTTFQVLRDLDYFTATNSAPRALGTNQSSTPESAINSSASFAEGKQSMANGHDETIREEFPPFTTRCPNLHTLTLQRKTDLHPEPVMSLLKTVIDPLRDLKHLDLSHWQLDDGLQCLITHSLSTLILYDVRDLHHHLDTILQISTLKCLDLSQSTNETGVYPRPVTCLHKIVTSLPSLTHLDISCTNLASQPSTEDRPFRGMGRIRSDIVGLRFLSGPLEFLGLFNCENASHYAEIPAKSIAGDRNEKQILLALRIYMERPAILQSVLNECYQLYRFGNGMQDYTTALHLILLAMDRHIQDSTLQTAGSASLYYLIRKVAMNRVTKRKIVTALLNDIDMHMEEQVIVRNCCLSLCQFDVPLEILFDYRRVAELLVAVLRYHSNDHLTQRIVIFLLNSMACRVEGEQKVQVGSVGAVEIVLEQIRRKHDASNCDDIMEVCWSFLWNITDETPLNCERFLKANGLRMFYMCYQDFQNQADLIRNMMGLIGNIAEVQYLRDQLMRDEYINVFCLLLSNLVDGIEISYNSAGVLSHLASDGEEAWSKVTISRKNVMDKIVQATESWNLDTRRFINYRSFKPILKLLPIFEAPASQHWALWALANLTTTDREKYCAYVYNEGGLPLLQSIINDHRSSSRMVYLCNVVLENFKIWKQLKDNASKE